jgi:hypothetical protein
MKRLNSRIELLLLLASILLLTSCRDIYIYRQDHPELNSMAIESIIGATSSEMNRVVILDEDEYGRTLFAFMGYTFLEFDIQNPHILAVAISQRSDNQYIYYYDTKNYIAQTIEAENSDVLYGDLSTYFSEESIEELKLLNDWNQPMDDSKMFRVSISRKKVCDVRRQEIRKYEDLFETKLNLNYTDCYSIDRNGIHLVSLVGFANDSSSNDSRIYLVLLNEEHELISKQAILDITPGVDLNEIFQFKFDWGWSFSYK